MIGTDALNRSRELDIESAYRQHMPWLRRRLALLTGDPDEAEDLAHQAFLRAIERWPGGSRDDAARWLATVGIRLAINELRRRRRWGWFRLHETHATWALQVDPDLWQALAALAPQPRAALLLTVLDGYTQAEAAQILGVPRGTIASWLSRANARLRTVIGLED